MFYTIEWTDKNGKHVRKAKYEHVNLMGHYVNLWGNLGWVWDIAVKNPAGDDVTGNFPCFD